MCEVSVDVTRRRYEFSLRGENLHVKPALNFHRGYGVTRLNVIFPICQGRGWYVVTEIGV